MGSFVLDNDQRFKKTVVSNRIATFGGSIQLDQHFVCQQFFRVAFPSDQIIDKMLTYPFPSFSATLGAKPGKFNASIYYICSFIL